jgi:hypothetical protein
MVTTGGEQVVLLGVRLPRGKDCIPRVFMHHRGPVISRSKAAGIRMLSSRCRWYRRISLVRQRSGGRSMPAAALEESS